MMAAWADSGDPLNTTNFLIFIYIKPVPVIYGCNIYNYTILYISNQSVLFKGSNLSLHAMSNLDGYGFGPLVIHVKNFKC